EIKVLKCLGCLCGKTAHFQQSLNCGLLFLFAEIGEKLLHSLHSRFREFLVFCEQREFLSGKIQLQSRSSGRHLLKNCFFHTGSSLSKSNLAKERSCERLGSCKICVCTGAVGNSSGCSKVSYWPLQRLSVWLQVTACVASRTFKSAE